MNLKNQHSEYGKFRFFRIFCILLGVFSQCIFTSLLVWTLLRLWKRLYDIKNLKFFGKFNSFCINQSLIIRPNNLGQTFLRSSCNSELLISIFPRIKNDTIWIILKSSKRNFTRSSAYNFTTFSQITSESDDMIDLHVSTGSFVFLESFLLHFY